MKQNIKQNTCRTKERAEYRTEYRKEHGTYRYAPKHKQYDSEHGCGRGYDICRRKITNVTVLAVDSVVWVVSPFPFDQNLEL